VLAAGDIPSIKLGGSRRITVAVLEHYIEALEGSPHDGGQGKTKREPVAPGPHPGQWLAQVTDRVTCAFTSREGGIRTRGLSVPNAAR
jgi:hypothetical protein